MGFSWMKTCRAIWNSGHHFRYITHWIWVRIRRTASCGLLRRRGASWSSPRMRIFRIVSSCVCRRRGLCICASAICAAKNSTAFSLRYGRMWNRCYRQTSWFVCIRIGLKRSVERLKRAITGKQPMPGSILIEENTRVFGKTAERTRPPPITDRRLDEEEPSPRPVGAIAKSRPPVGAIVKSPPKARTDPPGGPANEPPKQKPESSPRGRSLRLLSPRKRCLRLLPPASPIPSPPPRSAEFIRPLRRCSPLVSPNKFSAPPQPPQSTKHKAQGTRHNPPAFSSLRPNPIGHRTASFVREFRLPGIRAAFRWSPTGRLTFGGRLPIPDP